MTAVFDASVVAKVLTDEHLSDLAAAVVAEEAERIAPDLLSLEIASALSKKVRCSGLPRGMADYALAALPALSIDRTASSDLVEAAMSLSAMLRHALYDCLYLALAEVRGCLLVTTDDKVADVVAKSLYSHRVKRLSEYQQ